TRGRGHGPARNGPGAAASVSGQPPLSPRPTRTPMTRTSLVVVLSALGLAGPLHPAVAQEKKAPSLKAGDPAPPLTVTRWLQGREVKGFEPGRVYVVELWAT